MGRGSDPSMFNKQNMYSHVCIEANTSNDNECVGRLNNV